jgi:hypothetical protein
MDEANMRAAAEDYMKTFGVGWSISLGGGGGYLITSFDHSIMNNGGYSFSIEGNSNVTDWSEPGAVWVAQIADERGGPGPWYELRGSETGRTGTRQLYSVTWYAPDPVNQARGARWEDNFGNTGHFPYLTFRNQEIGFPWHAGSQWVTFTGTNLPSHLRKEALISHPGFPYGYVDNSLTMDIRTHFKISDAMELDGTPANLAHIDFIKVQNVILDWAYELGEISTEMGRPFINED